MSKTKKPRIWQRFQGYLPIVVDVETGGLHFETDALLEIAAVFLDFNEEGLLSPQHIYHNHVEAFEGARLDPKALEVNHIDPTYPLRFAEPEKKVLLEFFELIEENLHETNCRRAVLVGHNANFDLNFVQAAAYRCKIRNNPFHSFMCFDTATLSGIFYGKTVLAKALETAKISFDKENAHSALYDAEKTAELFCKIVNSIPFNF